MQTLLEVATVVYSTTREIYVRLTGDRLTTESLAAESPKDFPEKERDDVILFCDGMFLKWNEELPNPVEYPEEFEIGLWNMAHETWELEREGKTWLMKTGD